MMQCRALHQPAVHDAVQCTASASVRLKAGRLERHGVQLNVQVPLPFAAADVERKARRLEKHSAKRQEELEAWAGSKEAELAAKVRAQPAGFRV